MEIRPARPCDRRAVGRMTARTWRWGDYIMGVWRDWVSGERGRLFVAEESGRIVGIMYVEFRGRETYLAGARVAPEARGRGVGT
ncbi:MAG: N-acetyltransferase, partial [Thermoproteota archaeon]